jgi:hypothetical protein
MRKLGAQNAMQQLKAQKGLWVPIALAALLFFLLGASTVMWIIPGIKSMLSSSQHPLAVQRPTEPPWPTWPSGRQPTTVPPEHPFSFFMNPTFTPIATKEVADALHLTAEQIKTEIVSRNYGLSAIAAEQGILFNRLYPLEQKAVNDMLDVEIKAGYVSSEETIRWKNQFWDHPGKLDNVVQSMFSGLPVDISY